MKTIVYSAAISLALLFSCQSQKEEQNELALLKEQNELLKKQLLENQKAAEQQKVAEKIKVVEAVTKKKEITIDKIKQDLLGKRFEYVQPGLIKIRKGWEFASLSEFLTVSIENEITKDDYLEKTISMTLQDQGNGQQYYCKMLVSYVKFEGDWIMQRNDVLKFNTI